MLTCRSLYLFSLLTFACSASSAGLGVFDSGNTPDAKNDSGAVDTGLKDTGDGDTTIPFDAGTDTNQNVPTLLAAYAVNDGWQKGQVYFVFDDALAQPIDLTQFSVAGVNANLVGHLKATTYRATFDTVSVSPGDTAHFGSQSKKIRIVSITEFTRQDIFSGLTQQNWESTTTEYWFRENHAECGIDNGQFSEGNFIHTIENKSDQFYDCAWSAQAWNGWSSYWPDELTNFNEMKENDWFTIYFDTAWTSKDFEGSEKYVDLFQLISGGYHPVGLLSVNLQDRQVSWFHHMSNETASEHALSVTLEPEKRVEWLIHVKLHETNGSWEVHARDGSGWRKVLDDSGIETYRRDCPSDTGNGLPPRCLDPFDKEHYLKIGWSKSDLLDTTHDFYSTKRYIADGVEVPVWAMKQMVRLDLPTSY